MRRIALSGLVALAAVLGSVAVPAAAAAQSTAGAAAAAAESILVPSVAAPSIASAKPMAGVRPTTAARPGSAAAMRAAEAALAADGDTASGSPFISCVLATDCLGVEGGSSQRVGGAPARPRIARWNGSSWKGVRVTLPTGAKSVDLTGVSCRGAKSCLVVGDYYTSTSDSATSHALALAYNGTSLRPTATVPLPTGANGSMLTSVSCATTRHCVALGEEVGSPGTFSDVSRSVIIIETWNGARWTLRTAAGSIGKTTLLQPNVVSCATSAFCVLGGLAISVTSGSEKVYLASWNGRKLTTMKAPTVGGGTDYPVVSGLSCATAAHCAVAGAHDASAADTAGQTAFTEVWNGRTWRLATTAWPKGAALSFMFGVSCYGARSCQAVGLDAASDAGTAPFDAAAVSLNGTAGTVQAVPAPSRGRSTIFTAVSCLPWGSCVAVGATGQANAEAGAVMTGVWNGKAWKLEPGF